MFDCMSSITFASLLVVNIVVIGLFIFVLHCYHESAKQKSFIRGSGECLIKAAFEKQINLSWRCSMDLIV